MRRLHFYILIFLLGGVITSRAAHADPWPNLDSHTDEVDYVEIIADRSGDLWTFRLSVAPTAPIVGIKKLALYPTPLPDKQWAPENYAALRDGWDLNGCWEGKAFGYRTGPPAYYVLPGEIETDIGEISQLPYSFTELNYLVHVDPGGGAEAFWARPTGAGIIPEPSSLMALGMGLVGLAGFIRRNR